MQNGLQTDVCVLDFSNAFDKVGHRRLIEKLKWYGIQGRTNAWIESFLSNHTQSIVVEGTASDLVPALSGVPQGSVLGPCLFLFYINDIADGLTSTTCLFADDTMICMAVKSKADAQIFQQNLQKLERCESTWMMEFHPKKCEIISISRKRNPTKYQYTLHGHELKHVQVIKYLGTSISQDLRWDQHVDNIFAKANRTRILEKEPEYQEHRGKTTSLLLTGKTNPGVQLDSLESTHQNPDQKSGRGLEWQSLEDRRRAADLNMFYKIHNGRVAVDMSDTHTYAPRHRQQEQKHTGLSHHRLSAGIPQNGLLSKNQPGMEQSTRGNSIEEVTRRLQKRSV